jgi:diaminohydroxyphosphoribosylaminopyrimidine deaminase/5-amino-6-(5-phosphoribosylamino)uracil reductase
MSPIDPGFLDRALALAERGRAGVSPNPMVGAVVVRGGRVVGEGWHRRAGGPHAEIEALRRAGARARRADLYLTLEPCNHFGRTPPCVEAIVQAGIGRVIVAARDPNRTVAGGGLRALARAGIAVARPDAARIRRAERQNEKFRTWAVEGRPFVLAKWAASLDGRIAAAGGKSRWITGPAARRLALRLREEHDAVLVGAGTVLADDPLLTRRIGTNRGGKHWRIVLDGRLLIPERARLLADPEGVVVATSRSSRNAKARRLAARGVEVWSLPGDGKGRISIRALLRRLARRGVTSVLVEGGGETHGAFFSAGVVDGVAVFLAPRLIGGRRAPAAIAGAGFSLGAAPRLEDVALRRVGEDVLVTGRVAPSEARGRGRRPRGVRR